MRWQLERKQAGMGGHGTEEGSGKRRGDGGQTRRQPCLVALLSALLSIAETCALCVHVPAGLPHPPLTAGRYASPAQPPGLALAAGRRRSRRSSWDSGWRCGAHSA